MTEICEVASAKKRREYLSFLYRLYAGDRHYVDTAVFLVKRFLYRKDTFSKECFLMPLLVKSGGKTVAECMLLAHHGLDMLQIAFFEALPEQQDAVDRLLQYAAGVARKRGLTRIVVGLNGHVSYGVGLLLSGPDTKISFDSLYHKPYYTSYFQRYAFERLALTAYRTSVSEARQILAKYPRDCGLTYRTMDMRRFREECRLFGRLCDAALKNTQFYYSTGVDHMYELLNEMKFFLRPENLIFVLDHGREVGFLFWHPDYNELFRAGRNNSMLRLAWDYSTKRKRIQTVKLNAIGVLPAYWKTGAAVGLLRELSKRLPEQIRWTETNFVWDNNRNSVQLNKKMEQREYRRYEVYVGEVENGAF